MINEMTKGLVKENPVFIIVLGLCPTLAVSTTIVNALGMGLSVVFVLTCSNIFISLLKDFIPEKVRIPSYIVIISSFVTMVDLFMQAYIPSLSESLGVFVPLIVVNCVILGRAEAFASKNNVMASILDGIGMGLGFTAALVLIAAIREPLGSGQITLLNSLMTPAGSPEEKEIVFWANPIRIFGFAPGALIVMGLLKALLNFVEAKKKEGQ